MHLAEASALKPPWDYGPIVLDKQYLSRTPLNERCRDSTGGYMVSGARLTDEGTVLVSILHRLRHLIPYSSKREGESGIRN